MQIIRDNLTDRPTETSETPTLNETTHIVRTPANLEHGIDAYSQTFGVRWRIVNAKTGRIAGYAILDEYSGDTASGPVFDPREREALAQRLCASMPVWDDNLRESIVACLNTVAMTLLSEPIVA